MFAPSKKAKHRSVKNFNLHVHVPWVEWMNSQWINMSNSSKITINSHCVPSPLLIMTHKIVMSTRLTLCSVAMHALEHPWKIRTPRPASSHEFGHLMDKGVGTFISSSKKMCSVLWANLTESRILNFVRDAVYFRSPSDEIWRRYYTRFIIKWAK